MLSLAGAIGVRQRIGSLKAAQPAGSQPVPTATPKPPRSLQVRPGTALVVTTGVAMFAIGFAAILFKS